MKILCVTTYNNKLYNEYAKRFIETYNWPFDLKTYNEDDNLFDLVPECKAFVERNTSKFEGKDFIKDFRHDGVRFSYKVYAYTHAIMTYKEYDGIIGIDADWIKKHIHRENSMMTYLGRGDHYSECGFLYFNMKHKHTHKYALEMRKMYDEDLIYKEEEQHDSFIWDLVRTRFETKYQIQNYDIGDKKAGHVQARSILGTIYDHTKGPKRKAAGKSAEFRG